MIGPSIEIQGELTGGEDLLIEGRVDGKVDLRGHNVNIGKNGRVTADVFGKTITVEGQVNGNLFGDDQIILRQSSTVRGNLTAPRVSLEDGSNFKGSIDMTPKEGRGSAVPSEAKPAHTVQKPAAPPGGPVSPGGVRSTP